VDLECYGAAREVTSSCQEMHPNERTILLDCGLFLGRRANVQQKNLRLAADARTIEPISLSRARVDHPDWLPHLANRGFRRTIHAVVATRDLCEAMLGDSANRQKRGCRSPVTAKA
jgi:metallo-beta-lactamase family protein